MVNLIEINGVRLPTPSKFSVNIDDLDSQNSGRNVYGYMLRDRIRAAVYKVSIEWEAVTANQYRLIIDTMRNPKCTVKFFDPNTGDYVTKEFYVGTREGSLVRLGGRFDDTYNSYWSLKFNLTEV